MSQRNTELMIRVRDGDTSAFDDLMVANYSTVLGIIYRYLGRTGQEAEDLAQDVFLKVYRSRDRYVPTARFTTWLYRITANLCLNYRRDRARQGMASLEALGGGEQKISLGDPSAGLPEDDIDLDEVQTAVRQALEELPDTQRMAMILSRFQGLSYREIGDVLESSEKAIKSLLHRARVNLKERLETRLKDHFP